jgi:hypothetical protein
MTALVIHLDVEQAPRAVVVGAETFADYCRLELWLDRPSVIRDGLEALLGDEWRSAFTLEEHIGLTLVPAGSLYAGKSLAQVNALGEEGERWFVTMLARLGQDDWLRPAIEQYVRERRQDIWLRYVGWLRKRVESETYDRDDRPEREMRR